MLTLNIVNLEKKFFQYAKKNDHFKIISTIKHDTFLSCMKFIDVIVGNSSSGILEAPSLKVPTLNMVPDRMED